MKSWKTNKNDTQKGRNKEERIRHQGRRREREEEKMPER